MCPSVHKRSPAAACPACPPAACLPPSRPAHPARARSRQLVHRGGQLQVGQAAEQALERLLQLHLVGWGGAGGRGGREGAPWRRAADARDPASRQGRAAPRRSTASPRAAGAASLRSRRAPSPPAPRRHLLLTPPPGPPRHPLTRLRASAMPEGGGPGRGQAEGAGGVGSGKQAGGRAGGRVGRRGAAQLVTVHLHIPQPQATGRRRGALPCTPRPLRPPESSVGTSPRGPTAGRAGAAGHKALGSPSCRASCPAPQAQVLLGAHSGACPSRRPPGGRRCRGGC